jgi:hypothetical protein
VAEVFLAVAPCICFCNDGVPCDQVCIAESGEKP